MPEEVMSGTHIGSDEQYPEALLSWASHREGGVRRAFVDGGRPTGEIIETAVVKRISDWICAAAAGAKGLPRAIFLVGGPGNGKTDAVEQVVCALEKELGLKDEMRQHFARLIQESGGSPPRVLSIRGDRFPGALNVGELQVVQDASVAGKGGCAPEVALVEELAAIRDSRTTLYLCCLNRGILADAIGKLRRVPDGSREMLSLFEAISGAVAQGKVPSPCWPLEAHPWLAVWPMDAESLLEGENSPARQIFLKALDATRWQGCASCEEAELCPFKTNRDALDSSGERLDNLLSILRRYEVASGKRWTFRDLLSLVPQLLVGSDGDFRSDDGEVDPCRWVREQVSHIRSGSKSRQKEDWKARVQLSTHLYQHALFPAWPSLREVRQRMLTVTHESASSSPDREAPRVLFHWLSQLGQGETGGTTTAHRHVQEQNHVRRLLKHSLTPLLDPALADLDLLLTHGCSVRDIDVAFSRSVRDGTKRIKPLRDLSPLDHLLLELVSTAEDALEATWITFQRQGEAREIQRILRQFAARYAKRSVLVRRGVTRHHELFTRYREVSRNRAELNVIRGEFARLLNHEAFFHASLAQGLGQPERQRQRDVVLVSPKVSTKSLPISEIEGPDKAPTTTPFLVVSGGSKSFSVALTFQLYQTLDRLKRGAYPGCLPPEVAALIQRLKLRVAGQRVRDLDVLMDEDTRIELLDGKVRIQLFDANSFHVTA